MAAQHFRGARPLRDLTLSTAARESRPAEKTERAEVAVGWGVSLCGQFSQFQVANIKIEGVKCQSHCLCSLHNAL